jgi:5-methylthioadenosine/S-adenosylhomocysteine deaminase
VTPVRRVRSCDAHTLLGDTLDVAHAAVTETVEHFRTVMGEREWRAAREPETAHTEKIANPYGYTEWDGGDDRHRPEL